MVATAWLPPDAGVIKVNFDVLVRFGSVSGRHGVVSRGS